MFVAINRLWHEMCGKLHYLVEIKHYLHHYHEDPVQKKPFIIVRCGVPVDHNGCAVFIFKKVWTNNTSAGFCSTKKSFVMDALASVQTRVVFLNSNTAIMPPKWKWASPENTIFFSQNRYHLEVSQRCSSINRFIKFSGDNILNFVTEWNDISIARFEITDILNLNR